MHLAVQFPKPALCLELLVQLFMRKYHDLGQRWRDYSRNQYAFVKRFTFMTFTLIFYSFCPFPAQTLGTIFAVSVIPKIYKLNEIHSPKKRAQFLTERSVQSYPGHWSGRMLACACAHRHTLLGKSSSHSAFLFNRLKTVLNKSHSAACICRRI